MGKGAEQKEHRYFCRTKAGWLTLCLLLLCVLLLSLRFGSSGMDWQSFFGGLLRQEGFEAQSVILYSLRLPRLLQGVLAGIGLSVSGVLLQSVTGNDLASPNIIGVNAGAGFAVILILSYFPAAVMGLPLAAFLGAFLTTLAIMGIANRVDSSKATVILAGIAVQAVLSAGISFFSLLDTDVLVSYNYFSVGGLSNSSTDLLWLPGTIIFLGLAVSLAFSGKIQLLCLGDSMALSLGVKVKQVRMLCLVCASASAAAVVSFAGLLGFVGLMVPHISRKLAGTQTAPLLAVSAAVGSILVLTADLVGRTAFAPSEVPVGIVMSLCQPGASLYRRNYLFRPQSGGDDLTGAGAADLNSAPNPSFSGCHGGGADGFRQEPLSGFWKTDVPKGLAGRRRRAGGDRNLRPAG